MEEAIKERLKKLKAMIDGGTEHEREVAQKLYDALIDKHNLEINDIEEEKFKFDFTFKNIYEKMLMTRIHAVVTDDPEYWFYVDKRKRNKIRFKVTVSEWQIMQLYFELYNDSLQKDLELFMSAFFIKNQLFFNSGEDGENEDKSKNHYFMDEEELKIMAMMNGISTVEKPCGYIEDLK